MSPETGPGRAGTVLVAKAQRPRAAELAVRAQREATSARTDRWREKKESDERKRRGQLLCGGVEGYKYRKIKEFRHLLFTEGSH